MSIRRMLSTSPLHQIIPATVCANYKETSISFSGAPRKHPYDPEKMLLFCDPFSNNTRIFEFCIADITHVTELPSIGTDTGDNLQTVQIWVKKGSFGIKYDPFEIQEKPVYYTDSELLHQVLGERE